MRRVITLTVPPNASAPKSDEPGSVQHLDALHGVERNRDVAVVMARLRVVQAHAVDEHEHLTEVGAAHGEVGLHAATPRVRTSTDDASRSTSATDCTGSARSARG